jgi:hypothetical protein
MPKLTEIHFLTPITEPIEEIAAEIVDKIEPPENGILDYFYKGLAYVRIVLRSRRFAYLV